MGMLSNFKISRKLYALVFIAMAGMAGLAALTEYQIRMVYDEANFANVNTMPSFNALYDARNSFRKIQVFSRDHIIEEDHLKKVTLDRQILDEREKITKAMDRYQNDLIVDDEDRRLLDELRSAVASWFPVVEQRLALSRQEQDAEARALNERLLPYVENIEQAFSNHIAYVERQAARSSAQALARKEQAFRMSLAATALMLILLGAIGWMIGNVDLARPIARVSAALTQLAEGGQDVVVPGTTRGDEIGEIARAAQVFQEFVQRLDAQRWIKTQHAEITTTLQKASTIDDLAQKAISLLCQMIGAQHGLFYVLVEGRLEMRGRYGHRDRDGANKVFAIGDGLVGQCALDRRPIIITQPPTDYIRINSGLGEAPPAVIAVLPVLQGDDLRGVIEVAAVTPFAERDIGLLDELTPVIGMQLELLERSLRTIALLDETREQATRMEAQAAQLEEQSVEMEAQQSELAATEAWYKSIIAKAPDGALVVDSDGTIILSNGKAEELFGYGPGALDGLSVDELVPEATRRDHFRNRDSFMKSGGTRPMGAGLELTAVRADGSQFAVEIGLSRLPEVGGRGACAYASIRDVTEKQKAAAQLKFANMMSDTALELSIAGYWRVDFSDPDYYISSERAAAIFGEPPKPGWRYHLANEWLSRIAAVDPKAAEETTRLFQEAVEGRLPVYDAVYPYKRPLDGRVIWSRARGRIERDKNGKATTMYGVNQDITHIKMAEEELSRARQAAESATKAKSDFLASMSHEIRTPMNGITGMADLLAQTQLDDEQRHMIRTIRESGNALITVINDILDFSKIEAGKLDLENVTMAVEDAVEGVASTLTPNAAKKGARIQVFVDPKLPKTVHGDPTRLRQILFNMGGNAVKFSDGKDVQIRVDFAGKSDDTRTWLRFEVIDHGIGISKENQAKLFQAFSQAESSTTRRFGGTGLGLAICKRLTDIMGGALGVESREGHGSTFWVELPFDVAEGVKSNQKERDLHGLRVLLLGSEGLRAAAIEAYLTHWGAEVVLAPDVEAAPAALTESSAPIDSVMIDLGLDHDRQQKAVAALRKTTGGKVPTIVLQDYQNRGARILEKDVVGIDANPLIRYRIVSAVAVAAGRASPQIKAEDEAVMVMAGKAPTVEEALKQGQLILLAEDNLTNQDVIRRQLALVGHTCEIASNGAEALQAYKTGRYALLLTDCHMPEMDGYELTGAIRELERGTGQRLPIIAVTANALQGEAERCLAAGMDDYVSKPIAMPALVGALKKWMPRPKTSEPAVPAAGITPEPVREAKKSTTAVIDERALKDTFGDDDVTFREILMSFVQPSQDIIDEITEAWKTRSAAGVKDAAHKLKSSARSVGANALADICAALEAVGKTADWKTIDDLVPKARDVFAEVELYIREL